MNRPQYLMIDAIYDCRVDVIAAQCRDDDLFRTALKMRIDLLPRRKQSGALHDDIHIESVPRKLRGVALRKHLDSITVDDYLIALHLDLPRESPVRRVVTRQVSVCIGTAQIIDGDDVEVVLSSSLVVRPQDVTADASVAVDRHPDSHQALLLPA